MKILLDNTIYSRLNIGGIFIFCYELFKFFLSHIKKEELFFFESSLGRENFHRKQLPIDASQIIIEKDPGHELISKIMPIKVTLNDYYLYHFSYYRSLKTKDRHSEITTVHDFTHNFYSPLLKRIAHNKLKYDSIRKANGIICISNSTYSDLIRFCPPRKDQKVTVIHNGVSEDYFKILSLNKQQEEFLDIYNLRSDYLLFVGSRANYKNFTFVLELLKTMPNFKLVVVGKDFNKNELKLMNKELLSRIVIISNVRNEELNLLYNFAYAFLYPSSYEGFGIPLIEAMKAGCPVLSLNNSSISEVSGNAGILFDTLSLKNFKDNLQELNNINFRLDITEKGYQQAQKFSWRKCCEETHAFYKDVY